MSGCDGPQRLHLTSGTFPGDAATAPPPASTRPERRVDGGTRSTPSANVARFGKPLRSGRSPPAVDEEGSRRQLVEDDQHHRAPERAPPPPAGRVRRDVDGEQRRRRGRGRRTRNVPAASAGEERRVGGTTGPRRPDLRVGTSANAAPKMADDGEEQPAAGASSAALATCTRKASHPTRASRGEREVHGLDRGAAMPGEPRPGRCTARPAAAKRDQDSRAARAGGR